MTKRPEPPKSPVTDPAELCQIFTDRPVATARGLAFDFGGLAMTLAELAWNGANATPFTAVVRGGWGRGKTTLLRQTQRLLDEQADAADGRRQVRTVWFNAWKYPSDDTVLAGLLGALLDVYRQGAALDQLSFHVSNHKTRLARTVLHAAAPWAFGKPGDAAAWARRTTSCPPARSSPGTCCGRRCRPPSGARCGRSPPT